MKEDNPRFTFEFTETPIKNVFDHIQKHSNYIFLYYGGVVNANHKVSIKISNSTIDEVLRQLFKDTSITYTFKDRQIILKKKEQEVFSGQKKTIVGLIKDEKGEPIIGATVRTKEGSTGGITDIDGLYSINIPVEEQSLIVSYIGYQTQEVLLNNRQNITVELKEEVKEIEEVVVTAFGVGQKKNTLTGSVTQIRPKELRVPSSNLSSSFAGRLAGVIAVQRSGEPGADGADFWIRGKSTYSGAVNPLIIIDGMQVASDDLNNLDPEVIESFSILKDATATAMYGTLGANGVMIVTTKKGENLKKPIINFRLESSMSQLSKVPSMVDGATYMELYNEAASRPDASRDMYSQATIDATRAGIYPLVYPDVDWYDELFKKNSFSEKFHINVRGGSSWINYFMSARVFFSLIRIIRPILSGLFFYY